GWVCMAHSIGNRLLTNAVECIRDAQWQAASVAIADSRNFYRTAFDHALRTKLKRIEQVGGFERFRTQGRNAASRLFMAVAYKISSKIKLLVRYRKLFRDTVSDCFKLESDTGEALREGIVHFVGQPLTFFKHRTEPPVFYPGIKIICNQRQGKEAEPDGDQVAGIEPGRLRQHVNIFRRA